MIDRSGILTWEEKDRIGILRISSKKQGNTIPRPNFADPSIVNMWIKNENIEGIIVTGGERHFSSGADLSFFQSDHFTRDEIVKRFEIGEEILSSLEGIEKPVIAAINGACLGAGLEIALACHMRFSSKDAIFGFPEITHNIIPGHGGIQRMIKLIGKSKTLEIVLTGNIFGAGDAKKNGIVNLVTDQKNAFDYVFDAMKKIIDMGRKPVEYSIRSVNNALKMDYKSAIREECYMFAELVMEQYVNGGEDID